MKISFDPVANKKAIVHARHARFTILTSRLIRMEFSRDDCFEDRPSQIFWYRNQSVPEFQVTHLPDVVKIETAHLILSYKAVENALTGDTLNITLKDNGNQWKYGDDNHGNLLGTARTLDAANGAVKLEQGLMSRDGWSLINDSLGLVFNDESSLQHRGSEYSKSSLDLYFFGYGHDFRQCLKDYYKISGNVPLLPRWALGNWWSRYWEYTQEELTDLMLEFEQHDVPLSVCIVDMDWHLKGWTGYTWNNKLFPEPKKFIDFLKKRGIRTALNLHPADGIHPHEKAYHQVAEFMGKDPLSGQKIIFDITDPKFIEAYFKFLHHPHEEDGIDFWWMDWQQGEKSGLAGLDPLWALNHLHFHDLGRDESKKRAFVFSRWGGLGNHRYPIGFSGDTFISWEMLQFQPYFTSTAANVGYTWWSHDIGGHYRGMEDGELYARWIQFGVFSPILRLHTSKFRYIERRPWAFDDIVFKITRKAMQFRHALIPYIYTMSWLNSTEGVPLVSPMYYDHPEDKNAYQCPGQYYFGTELIAAPFITPKDKDTGLARKSVWLPKGEWYDFFTGERYSGDCKYAIYGDLSVTPVFAKAGAIVVLAHRQGQTNTDNPSAFEVNAFAGADHQFSLYEDDGVTQHYKYGKQAITTFNLKWSENSMFFSVNPVTGDKSVIPEKRTYLLKLRSIAKPDSITVCIDGIKSDVEYHYDDKIETLDLDPIEINSDETISVELKISTGNLCGKRNRTKEKLINLLWNMNLPASTKSIVDWLMNISPASMTEDIYQLMHRNDAPATDFWEINKRKGKFMPIAEDIKINQLVAIYEVMQNKELTDTLFSSDQQHSTLDDQKPVWKKSSMESNERTTV